MAFMSFPVSVSETLGAECQWAKEPVSWGPVLTADAQTAWLSGPGAALWSSLSFTWWSLTSHSLCTSWALKPPLSCWQMLSLTRFVPSLLSVLSCLLTYFVLLKERIKDDIILSNVPTTNTPTHHPLPVLSVFLWSRLCGNHLYMWQVFSLAFVCAYLSACLKTMVS